MALVNYAKIIGRAEWVRYRSGLTGDPPYSMRQVFDRLFPKIAVAGSDLPTHILEMAVADGEKRALFYNRRVNHSAQRVGLAHGLYHHISDIRHEDGLRECNVATRKLADHVPAFSDPVELACDLFAGELLTPLDVLDRLAPDPLWGKGSMDKDALNDEIDHLASRFNVPQGFMKWRLFDLHALRKSHYNLR